jgi:hypothetical protein
VADPFRADYQCRADLGATRRLWFRLIEADHAQTNFENRSDNRQNNLRLSTAVIFRF